MNAKLPPADHLLSSDELERRIVDLSAQINSSEGKLLALIHQFDGRAVPGLSHRAQEVIDDVVGSSSDEAMDNDFKNLSKVVNIPSAEG